jgi:hypothetical protein
MFCEMASLYKVLHYIVCFCIFLCHYQQLEIWFEVMYSKTISRIFFVSMWLTIFFLQNAILLNCFQSLLTHVSRATKNTLNKLGVFTVSSFHAFICARSPSLLNNLLAGRGATKRRPPMLSRSNSGSSRRSLQMTSREESEKTVKVSLPDNQVLEDKIMCLLVESNAVNCEFIVMYGPYSLLLY